jgi:hypothetical protein
MRNQHNQDKPIIGSVGFFISPDGMLIGVEGGNHISTVIANFSKFGLTIEQIQRLYTFFGEKLGVEGVARQQILTVLIQQGWIRLRRHQNKHWSVNINELTCHAIDFLEDWANKFLTGFAGWREPDPYMAVSITDRVGKIKRLSIKEMAEGALGSVSRHLSEVKRLRIKFLENAAMLPDMPPLNDCVNALEPQVGIIFLVEGELTVQSVPVSKGEDDGHFVNDPRGHEKSWTVIAHELERRWHKPFSNKSYDYYPRGRCLYSKKVSRFLLYVDPCILRAPVMLAEIICKLQIPAEKADVVSDDLHYRCSGCNPRYVPDALVGL